MMMTNREGAASAGKSPWWKGSRGEWYVAGQVVIGVLIFFGPRTLPGWPVEWPSAIIPIADVIGALLLVAGSLLFLWGLLALGKNLTPLPHPKEHSAMVERGPYRFVRHPMYGGVIVLVFGFALLVHGWLTVLFAVLLFFFLDRKSRREEQWLMEKFPAYAEYRGRVARLIPFIY